MLKFIPSCTMSIVERGEACHIFSVPVHLNSVMEERWCCLWVDKVVFCFGESMDEGLMIGFDGESVPSRNWQKCHVTNYTASSSQSKVLYLSYTVQSSLQKKPRG